MALNSFSPQDDDEQLLTVAGNEFYSLDENRDFIRLIGNQATRNSC